ncbi:MAG: hypothetical protein ACR2KG_00560 [Nocardioidaceae bacterium]
MGQQEGVKQQPPAGVGRFPGEGECSADKLAAADRPDPDLDGVLGLGLAEVLSPLLLGLLQIDAGSS